VSTVTLHKKQITAMMVGLAVFVLAMGLHQTGLPQPWPLD